MNLIETVAKNIRYYRKKQNLSQEKLAELSNLHRTYVGSVERGERNLSLKNIEKIAQALKISPYELLRGEDFGKT